MIPPSFEYVAPKTLSEAVAAAIVLRKILAKAKSIAALQSEAPYVVLIASKKRASAILQYLNESNLTQ